MTSVREVVSQTPAHAYAHHIQRLMATNNFTLLAGIESLEVHAWHLAVYADASEWVGPPNTLGMSQPADDGLLPSKPYAARGACINRMSDCCKSCAHCVTARTGPRA
jgi:deoxyribodipyrimidine photolyase-related protein